MMLEIEVMKIIIYEGRVQVDHRSPVIDIIQKHRSGEFTKTCKRFWTQNG